MRPLVRHLILVAVVGVLAVSCGDETAAQLRSLEEDPLATIEPDGVISTRESTSKGSASGCLRGKSTPTTLWRTFEMAEGTTEEAVEELAQAADDAGWELERSTLGYRGEKDLDGRRAHVAIDGVDSPEGANVSLDLRIDNT